MKNSRHFHLIIAYVCLAAIILFAYWNSGQCEFVGFDDDLYVSNNTYVQQGLTWTSVKWAFTAGHASTWQPLVWLSYMMESNLLGHKLDSALFHWTNILFHILNTILLFILLERLTGRFWLSAAVAALFAVHPIHVESVVWVAERKDVLSTFFFLSTLLAYNRYTKAPGLPGYLLFFSLFILGLMAKPMLVTLPFILLILDFWPLHRHDRGVQKLFLEKIPLFLPVLASVIITIAVQQKGGSMVSFENTPLGTRMANIPVFYISYLTKIFWPHPLAILYPYPGKPENWFFVLSLTVLAFVTWSVMSLHKERPYLVAGWLWYIVTLLPVIGILRIGLHGTADRFLYIPAIGIYIMIVMSAVEAADKKRAGRLIAAVFMSLLIPLLMILTRNQTAYWKDNVTLFTHAVRVTENNWAMHNCLGAALERKGQLSLARDEFEKAAAINAERPRVFYNLGCVYQRMNSLPEAIKAYKRALALDPENIKTIYNLGCAMERMEEFPSAIDYYLRVLKLSPSNVLAYNNLGTVYTKMDNPDKAVDYYGSALQIAPDYINARYNLGAVLFQLGRYDQAAYQFTEIIKRKPDYQPAIDSLNLVISRMKALDINER